MPLLPFRIAFVQPFCNIFVVLVRAEAVISEFGKPERLAPTWIRTKRFRGVHFYGDASVRTMALARDTVAQTCTGYLFDALLPACNGM